LHRLAWDCATGNGQAAQELARHFERVVATDASAEQIAQAAAHPSIDFRVEPAESSSLEDRSVDLLTVAQALHWFDFARFCGEAGRVAVAGGIVAVWCYGLARVDEDVDAAVGDFYEHTIGPYWPPERRMVESGYRELQFPWSEVSAPEFCIVQNWDLAGFLAYLGTWSAVRRYRADRGTDPVAALRGRLAAAWGAKALRRRISWPIALRVFRAV
jgi:hypothetical protein